MCRGIQVGPNIKQIISLYATSELITSQELRHQKKKPQYLNGYVTLTKLTARMPSYGKMKVIRNLTQFYLELLEALNLSLLPLFESPCIERRGEFSSVTPTTGSLMPSITTMFIHWFSLWKSEDWSNYL